MASSGQIKISIVGLTRAQWDAIIASLKSQITTWNTGNPTALAQLAGQYSEEA
ncbi:MAG TPA: hypothetical protein VFE98_02985 [Candidatus Bathyarchaeia archaeon]|nr:hypothetical protein [Candidatus Bathyarchaeia archaeon]